MMRYLIAYVATGLAFAVIDAVWLTTMTNKLYKPVLGPIMLAKPNMVAAVAFYLIMIGGIVFFAVAPALREGGWTRALLNGAVLGLVAYATYDLTNQATLAVWQTKLTILDLCWGTFVTGTAATVGYLATRWFEAR
ncbi:hypothetical protein ASG17_06905 [Brevundimonas sp. Leaf363]|nr:DUF2177 family protein [Brevundimonas sp. Leaf363]KQS55783.1 hypothetical protein ASG17_06905 [Brevundimonas sp. Leaf363]